MSNPLTDILPPRGRKILYAVGYLVGIGLFAIQIAYVALGTGQPSWLTALLAVYVFLAGVFGFPTAAANVNKLPAGDL